MSESDKRKKEHEREVFESALRVARKKGGEARRNVDRLSGNIDSSDEEPDLVVRAQGGRIVGIEHFRVDQLVKPGKSAQSAAARFSNDNEKKRKAIVEGASSSELNEEMVELFGNVASEAIRLSKNSCLDDLVRSIDAGLFGKNGHAYKLDAYREHLQQRFEETYSELGYLIELHSDFRGLFCHDGHAIRRLSLGELPMFTEIYALLLRASRDVDWIVLACCGSVTNEVIDAVVIDCRNGRFSASLRRQGMRPTEYLGLGKDAPKAVQERKGEVTVAVDGDVVTYSIENTSAVIEPAILWDNALSGGARALTLAKRGETFTATVPVEMVFDLLRDQMACLGANVTYDDVAGLIAKMPENEKAVRLQRFAKRWDIRDPSPSQKDGGEALAKGLHDDQ